MNPTFIKTILYNIMDRKKKAAIAAVLVYLKEEKKKDVVSNWSIVGRRTLMNNRQILQNRGKFN